MIKPFCQGFPPTHRLHGRDEGAVGDHRPQGEQDRSDECECFAFIPKIFLTSNSVSQIEVAPCNKKGKEYTEKDDKFVDSPDELIGKDLHFLFKIVNCRGLPNKYTDVYCKYKVYLDEKVSLTHTSKIYILYWIAHFYLLNVFSFLRNQ